MKTVSFLTHKEYPDILQGHYWRISSKTNISFLDGWNNLVAQKVLSFVMEKK